MKLKILPPTLRQKKRYISLKLYSVNKIQKDEAIQILWNSILNTYGEIESSKINLWLIDFQKVNNDKRHEYDIIVRCNRQYEKKAITAFHTIRNHRKNKMVVHPQRTSGTIKSLSKKLENIAE